jgi:hypothetical protein
MKSLVCVRCPFDVQLVASRAIEGVLLVRPDLGLDVEGAQEGERPACDRRTREIEMQCDLAATSQVDAAGDVEQSGELGEAVAVRIGRDLGELVAQLVRE